MSTEIGEETMGVLPDCDPPCVDYPLCGHKGERHPILIEGKGALDGRFVTPGVITWDEPLPVDAYIEGDHHVVGRLDDIRREGGVISGRFTNTLDGYVLPADKALSAYLVSVAFQGEVVTAGRIQGVTVIPQSGWLWPDNPTTAARIVTFSHWLDSTNTRHTAEAWTWGRVMKVAEEAGEVYEAWAGVVGHNPRKVSIEYDRDDVVKELLDTAHAALGAIEHLRGHRGDALDLLAEHAAHINRRAGLE